MNKEQITNETKEDITFDARPSTVFFEQWYQVIKDYPLKERDKAYKYIFEYAFYGIEPEKTKVMSLSYSAFGMAKANIISAQKRYDEAVERGQKGGRPKKVTEEVRQKIAELRKNGMTQKQVAVELSLSLKTIQRVEKDKSQNHNVNVNGNVNDNVDVKDVASKEDNIMASPITESETPTPPPTELSDMEIYENKVSVINLFRNHKRPIEIVNTTGFEYGFVNSTIDDYKSNGYKFPDKPKEVKQLDIPLMDGNYYWLPKKELFDRTTDNGTKSIEDIDWSHFEHHYIMAGINPFDVKKLIKEFQQKLKGINDMKVLERVATN